MNQSISTTAQSDSPQGGEPIQDSDDTAWRQVFSRLHEGVIFGQLIRDNDGNCIDWRYLDVNPAWTKLVGVSHEAAIGRTVREVFPGIEDDWVSDFARVVDTGTPSTFTRPVGALGRRYDGRAFRVGPDRFVVLFAELSIRDSAKLALSECLLNIDDPVELSYAVAELIGRALGVSRAGYGTIDLAKETFTVERDWNAPGIKSLKGVLHFRDFGSYIDDLKRGETAVVADAKLDPRTQASATALKAISAEAFINMPVSEQGGLVAMLYLNHETARPWSDEELAFVRDTAQRTRTAVERRRAERDLRDLAASLEQQVVERTAALQAGEARFKTIFETSFQLQGLLSLDGTVLDANATSLEAINARLVDIVGTPYWDAPWFAETPGMPETIRDAVDRAGNGHEGKQEVTINLSAGPRTCVLTVRPIRDGEGRVMAIVAEAMDITEQRQAEEALRQAQKMEAVGQLTGGLAHDFNNLLTAIGGSLELLHVRLAQGKSDELQRFINAAKGACNRAAALTHRLLAFSRRQTLDPKPTDVNRLVAGMEELIRRTVGPEIKVETVAMGGLWKTLIDAHQLENALLNLCINARDAMPDGGCITIETGNRWLDERGARERDLVPGQYISLCVSDTGTGMTPEIARRAFDPFFTTKPIGMGTGLGLSMVYGFVRQSGGQIRIYSEENQGAMICLYLPRAIMQGDLDDAKTEDRAIGSIGKGETVLVVDDEPTIRMLVVEVLKDLGYCALEADDGASALKIIHSDLRIDLLVTDVGLPNGMNGRQLAEAARGARSDLKVLFITGYAENAVLSHGHLEQGMHVLTKPFAMDTIAERIRTLVDSD
jgi:PAS domain S-box-containing protein